MVQNKLGEDEQVFLAIKILKLLSAMMRRSLLYRHTPVSIDAVSMCLFIYVMRNSFIRTFRLRLVKTFRTSYECKSRKKIPIQKQNMI